MREDLFASLALCAAYAALPAPALAQDCPATPQDAANGIAITYGEGSSARITLDMATGTAVEDFVDADGYRVQSTLMLAVVPVSVVALDSGGATISDSGYGYTYATPAPEAGLAPGLSWSSPYDVTSFVDTPSGQQRLTMGAEIEISIGPCRYRAWPATLVTADADYAYVSHSDYLPDLGISVLRGFGEFLKETVMITPIRIEIVAKP